MRTWLAPTLLAFALAGAGCSAAESEPTPTAPSTTAAWSYEGATGPQAWGELDPAYEACSSGIEQSPVDLSAGAGAATEVLLDYVAGPAEAEDTGHAEELVPGGAQLLTIDGVEYRLDNVHIHLPSEHRLEGREFAGEAHFVHVSAAGDRVVVGRFLDEGADNPAWDPFIEATTETEPGAPIDLEQVDWAAMAPPSAALSYDGSLTTPPCSVGVAWFVGLDPIPLGAAQLATLEGEYLGNNRPVQPLGDRLVGQGELAVG